MWPLILAYIIIAGATAMAWAFLIGAFAVGLGFAATGVLKLLQRRWWPAVACLFLAIASLLFIYAYSAGLMVL